MFRTQILDSLIELKDTRCETHEILVSEKYHSDFKFSGGNFHVFSLEKGLSISTI